jgi:hypothetical protein
VQLVSSLAWVLLACAQAALAPDHCGIEALAVAGQLRQECCCVCTKVLTQPRHLRATTEVMQDAGKGSSSS